MVNINHKKPTTNSIYSIVFFFILLFSFTKISAQDFSFPSIALKDSTSIDNALIKLTKQLITVEEAKDDTNYFNLLSFHIIIREYEKVLVSLDSFKANNTEQFPGYIDVMGIQYEYYSKTNLLVKKTKKPFDTIFNEIFDKKVKEITKPKELEVLPYFFDKFYQDFKSQFDKLIVKQKNKETISTEDAIKLTHSYSRYLVYYKTAIPGSKILMKNNIFKL